MWRKIRKEKLNRVLQLRSLINFSTSPTLRFNLARAILIFLILMSVVIATNVTHTSSTDFLGTFNFTGTDTENITLSDDNEFPNNQQGYLGNHTGWLNMTGNILLLHLNNDSDYGEKDTLVYDFSGNQNNGTAVATAKPNSDGQIKGCFEFDGNSDYLNHGDSSELRPTSVTVMAWANPTAITGTAHFAVSMPYGDGGWDSPYVGYGIGVGTGGYRFWLNINGVLKDINAGSASTGKWQHIVLTFNGTTVEGYADGANIYSSSASSGSIQYSGTPDLIVGQRSSSAPGEYFNGLVDEVAVFNRSLSSSEIKEIYDNQKGKYFPSGDYVSQVIDATTDVSWDYLKWSNATNGIINFQAKSCDDSLCSGELFIGPDNTSSTYFLENTTLNTTLTPNNQYFQYKAFFETSNTTFTPYLESVDIGYTSVVLNPSVNSTLDSPADLSTDSDGNIIFTCSATATDSILTNITFYYNLTGSFEANQTNAVSGISNSTTFNLGSIADGTSILWNCLARNNESNASFAVSNRTVTVSIPPLVTGHPTMLSIQGKVTNSTGSIVDDANLGIKISNSNSCSGNVFDHTYNNEIRNGLFSVLLGDTYELNLTYNENYWLCTYINSELVGSASKFRGGQGEIGSDDLDENIAVSNLTAGSSSAPKGITLYSPDESASCCSVDNNDAWSCTAGACT